MIDKNIFRKTEAILYSYPQLEAEIRCLELEINNIKNNYEGCGAIGYEERTQATNKFNSAVENEVINKEKEISALEVWSKIWNFDKESQTGINLKIAIATALEFASPVNTWLTNKPLDSISRYNSFKDANKEGILFPCFKDLSIKDLRNVVNAKITDDTYR